MPTYRVVGSGVGIVYLALLQRLADDRDVAGARGVQVDPLLVRQLQRDDRKIVTIKTVTINVII